MNRWLTYFLSDEPLAQLFYLVMNRWLTYFLGDEPLAYLFYLVMNRWLANTRKDDTSKYPIPTFHYHLPG